MQARNSKAGGIDVLRKVYQLIPLTENEFDPFVADVVVALASLVQHAACLEQFAESHGELVLMDFLWKCSTTRTSKVDIGEDGEPVYIGIPGTYEVVEAEEPTSFNRDITRPAETEAGRALWYLTTLNDEWKRRVLYLGALIELQENGEAHFSYNLEALEDAEDCCSQVDVMRGWFRVSNYLARVTSHTGVCLLSGAF